LTYSPTTIHGCRKKRCLLIDAVFSQARLRQGFLPTLYFGKQAAGWLEA